MGMPAPFNPFAGQTMKPPRGGQPMFGGGVSGTATQSGLPINATPQATFPRMPMGYPPRPYAPDQVTPYPTAPLPPVYGRPAMPNEYGLAPTGYGSPGLGFAPGAWNRSEMGVMQRMALGGNPMRFQVAPGGIPITARLGYGFNPFAGGR